MKLKDSDFKIEIAQSRPKITRNLTFSSGDTISFCVTLDVDASTSIRDLHHKSAEHVIALLQDWLTPPKA